MLGDLLVYLPADEERMQTALTAVVAALEGAVARTSVPPWPSAVTAVSQLAQVRGGGASVPPWPSAATAVSQLAQVKGAVPLCYDGSPLAFTLSAQLMPTRSLIQAAPSATHHTCRSYHTCHSILSQAVQFRRFRQAVRLIRCLACFESLLSRALLVRLAVSGLAVAQCLPYLRGALAVTGGNGFLLAVVRLEAVAGAMPTEWFQGECAGLGLVPPLCLMVAGAMPTEWFQGECTGWGWSPLCLMV